jgi:hypothetical protein
MEVHDVIDNTYYGCPSGNRKGSLTDHNIQNCVLDIGMTTSLSRFFVR